MSYQHKCLTCGTRIGSKEKEVKVEGKKGNPDRYRHESEEDCRKALHGRQGRASGKLPSLVSYDRDFS